MSDESLFERYKNEIRTRLSVRELVEEAKPKGLRATGAASLICCSPLRADKSPSFSVFEGGGGEYVGFDHATRETFDLYSYIERRENLSFAEAVKWAGDRVGMPWDDYKRQHGVAEHSPPPPGISETEWDRARDGVLALDERQLVANVQQAMVDLAHAMFLRSSLPAYVERRWGISPETQGRFLLGFIPHGFADLLDALHEQGDFPYSRGKCLKTGWFIARSGIPGDPNPKLRCLFDGRLLYPYILRGRCRYAAARLIFEQSIEPTYWVGRDWDRSKFKKALVGGLSHPSVSKYVQNDLLYNADNTLRSRSGFKRVVIVEGPSDCMVMVEQGYDCVAPVTTSVRNEDVPALVASVARYEEVLLATDTDVKPDGRRPGLEGALRMAPALMASGRRVRLLVLPLAKGQTKMDPAEWALQWRGAGKEGDPFRELVDAALPVAAALVQFLDQDLTAAQLPAAMTPIVTLARGAKASRAELEEIARLTRKRLKENFTRTAILAAMGEVAERMDQADRPAADERDTVKLSGAVFERGGYDEPGKVCFYESPTETGVKTISTFILQPERIVISSKQERLLEVSVHVDVDTRLLDRWVVPKGAWVGKKDLIKALPHERLQFTGSDDNVQAIYQLVSQRASRIGVPVVRGEPVVGLHYTSSGLRLVLPSETWDQAGKMADPDIVYSSEGNAPLAMMMKTDGAQDPADVDDLTKRVIEQVFVLNDLVALTTICAWILGCYFLPQIRELNGGKASILNVFGSPGSGKTTLMQKILNVTLLPFGSSFEPATPAETRFATIRNLSWANILCSPFDEFRTSEADEAFLRILRTGFSGGTEQRGRADQTVRSYPLLGAAQLAGEQRADADPAMAERLVMVGLDRTTIEQRDVTKTLHEVLAIDEKWRIATDVLQWRMKVDRQTIASWWSDAKLEATTTIQAMKLRVAPRTLDLCVEMAFRLRALREWVGWRGAARVIDVQLAPLDKVIRRFLETSTDRVLPEDGSMVTAVAVKSLVVRALEAATPYAIAGTFEEKRGWRICDRKGRRMLVVHPGVLASLLARESKLRGTVDPTNGESALRRSAKEEFAKEGELGWMADYSFPYRMGSTDAVGDEESKQGRARCWLIDVERAQERAGLDVDWPGDVAQWGGNRRKPPPPGTVGSWRRMTQTGLPDTSAPEEE